MILLPLSTFAISSNLNNNSTQPLDSFTEARENFFSDDSAQTANSKEVMDEISNGN